MYERTRQVMSFNIAGFSHWYGAEKLSELTIGTHVELCVEPDNPYDTEAVAILFDGTKLGYIPRTMNYEISQMLFFGYADIYDAIVTQVTPDAHPEKQVRVSIFLKDARK